MPVLQERRAEAQEGFLLIGALIAVFLVLLVLSIAAPTVARQLRREREVEAVHRADQYVRAIQLYYGKFKHYPGTVEQLEKSNNIRFLRQKYADPMTGKADWRLIHVGEQKTTVKGFFGQPLAGLPTTGLGSSIGGAATVGGTGVGASSPGSAFGGVGASSSGSAFGRLGAGAPAPAGSTVDSGATGGQGSGSGSGSGIGSQSATTFGGSGAPFLGVGSSASGESIVVVNEQTTHPTWEFLYDPRIEQMKTKSNLLGGGMSSSGATGLGGAGSSLSSPASGSSTPFGSSSPGTPTPTTTAPQQQ